jgi:hypothetical protein
MGDAKFTSTYNSNFAISKSNVIPVTAGGGPLSDVGTSTTYEEAKLFVTGRGSLQVCFL